jgi:hypothetical protein
MKKLLDMGFKKVPTEDGFHMYELTPARLPQVEEPRIEKRASLQARKRTSLTSK